MRGANKAGARLNGGKTVIERGENGQFAKGNSGGPGRPRLDVEQKYLRTLHRALLQRDVREVVKKLIARAKAGNIQAAKVLLEYAIGKPTQYVNADVLTQIVEFVDASEPPSSGTPETT